MVSLALRKVKQVNRCSMKGADTHNSVGIPVVVVLVLIVQIECGIIVKKRRG
jgi:hypothetical protein